METDLRFVIPLLRLLNVTPQLRMNYQEVCGHLAISVQELQDTALSVNDIEPLLVQEGEDLVLLHPLDLLDAKAIFAGVSMRGRFALKEVTTSTNAELVDEKANLVSGDALVAEIQTQGRGRRDTRWFSSIGTNIMLSMAFKFESLQQLLGFSLAVGVANVIALESLGVRGVNLKWPNDLYFQDKKLAGILIESVPTPDSQIFAIVGVGVNVHRSRAIESSLDRPFISLDEMGYDISRNELCVNIINEIKYAYNAFRKNGFAPFIDFYQRHDALRNRLVEVAISDHRRVAGRVAGVNALGELILDSNSGRTAIRSGHILSIRG